MINFLTNRLFKKNVTNQNEIGPTSKGLDSLNMWSEIRFLTICTKKIGVGRRTHIIYPTDFRRRLIITKSSENLLPILGRKKCYQPTNENIVLCFDLKKIKNLVSQTKKKKIQQKKLKTKESKEEKNK
jgi:hypothetical protein